MSHANPQSLQLFAMVWQGQLGLSGLQLEHLGRSDEKCLCGDPLCTGYKSTVKLALHIVKSPDGETLGVKPIADRERLVIARGDVARQEAPPIGGR